MASRIAGITIEIGGDTTNLQKSLKGVDSSIKKTQAALKDVNKLLKLDPTNTDLLKQKQQLLKKAVEETKQRLDALKQAQAQMDANGVDKNSAQYQALQREIIATEQELKKAKKAADNFHPALEKVKASAQKAADGLKSAAEKTRGFSTAAAGVLTALGGLGVKALTTADDLNTMAQRTGLSTDELQRFAYASDRVDVSVESIAGALKKLKSKIDPNNKSLNKLGVAATNADGSLRNANEVFYDVLEALSKIENETERDQMAMEIFGKSADELAGIIDDGGAALKAYGDEAERAGAIMDEETIASLNDMNDEFDRLKAQGMATLIQTGAKALQALSPVLEKVAAAVGKVLDWISKLSPETLEVIITVLALVAAITPLLTMLSGLATAIAFLASPIGIAVVAIGALIAIGVLLWKNWDDLKAKAEEIATRVKKSWQNLTTAVKTAVNNAKTAVTTAWNSIKTSVVNTVSTLKSNVQISFNNIKTAVVNSINNAKTAVTTAWTNIKTSVISTVETLKTNVQTSFNNIKNSIVTPITNAKAAVQGAIASIKGMFPLDIGKIFSDIKLPHFKIDGGEAPWGIAGEGRRPSISIDWYRKAMNQPYLLNGATIFGAMGGKLLGGGEAGREVILSYDKLREMGSSQNITINVYAAPGQSPKEVAHEVQKVLVSQQRQRSRAYA